MMKKKVSKEDEALKPESKLEDRKSIQTADVTNDTIPND